MTTNMPPWPGLNKYSNQMLFPGGELFFYQNKNASAKNPPLVFIHGLGDEADTWRHILPRLEDYKFLAPDLPGFGRSTWHGKISISCHANTIIELISATLNEPKEQSQNRLVSATLNEPNERSRSALVSTALNEQIGQSRDRLISATLNEPKEQNQNSLISAALNEPIERSRSTLISAALNERNEQNRNTLVSATLNERNERNRNARIERSRNALLDKSATTHPVVLIGSSMGAGVAELIAFKRPDLVKALVLMDGCFPITGSVSPQLLLAGLPLVGRNWYRSFRSNHEAAWKSLYAYYKNLDAMSAEDKQFLRDRVIARVESDNQERGYFSSLRSTNAVFMFQMKYYSQKIKNFKGKILLVWGEHDHVMPVSKASVFTNLRPDAELKTISGTGHLPHQENPEETLNVLLDFLNKIG